MTFEAFPKISRLRRNVIVTEKIDGTNAQVFIEPIYATPLPDYERLKGGVPIAYVNGMAV